MLIRNYGHFWLRSAVVWGSGAKDGHIRGVMKNARNSTVTFDDQQGVYALYDDRYDVVYVGQAGTGNVDGLFARLRVHHRNEIARRWAWFSWFGTLAVNAHGQLHAASDAWRPKRNDVLDQFEAILIAVADPRLNRQGGRFGKGVTQYLQYTEKTHSTQATRG